MNLLKPKTFPTLLTPRLRLRKPLSRDSTAYHQLLSYDEISRFSDVPHKPTKKRSERFISWMSNLHTRGKGVGWIISLKNSDKAIGSIRINSIEKKAQYGVIGYELHPDHWGSGLATEALEAVVGFAHNDLSLNRLEAWTSVDNIASQKVLTNNGFQYEGTQRQKVFFQGELWDVQLYGRLAADSASNR